VTRGSIQLRHRKGCDAPSKPDARACRCAPTVYVVLERQWIKAGYLDRGWRKSELEPFEAKLADMRGKLSAGEPWQPRKLMHLAEYADGWFDELAAAAQAGRISRLTYNTYLGSWENHLAPAFGALPLAAIDAGAVRKYVNAKLAAGLAPVTVNSTLTPLSAMLTDAVTDGLIAANPARQPRRARHGSSRRGQLFADARREAPKHLEPVEALALLNATPAEHRTMVLAALTTGARRGELLGLRWEWIDFAKRRVWIGGQLQGREPVGCKYASEREVVLYSGLAAALGPRRQAEGFVFLGPDDKAWLNQGPERDFLRDAYDAAGLRRPGKMWHLLRHTYASVLAAGGIRRDVVEELMGHKRQGTTSLYSHLFRDAYDGVDEALDRVFGVNQPSTAGSVPAETDVSASAPSTSAVGSTPSIRR
jgi:integrase